MLSRSPPRMLQQPLLLQFAIVPLSHHHRRQPHHHLLYHFHRLYRRRYRHQALMKGNAYYFIVSFILLWVGELSFDSLVKMKFKSDKNNMHHYRWQVQLDVPNAKLPFWERKRNLTLCYHTNSAIPPLPLFIPARQSGEAIQTIARNETRECSFGKSAQYQDIHCFVSLALTLNHTCLCFRHKEQHGCKMCKHSQWS